MKNLIPADYKKILIFIIILAFYASFLLIKISLPHMDNDTGLYIMDGKTIWETQNVFRNNIYSFTVPDHPVYDHHWMSSVVFYLVSEIFGFGALTILKTAILLSAFAILFIAAMKKANFWLVAVFSLPTILILAGRNRIRPEMFSYLFLALFLYLLFDLEKHPERKRIFWLIPLQLLWVNFHLFFFLGIVLVAGFLFEKVVLYMPKIRLRQFGRLADWRINLKNLRNDPVVKKLLSVLFILFAVIFINPNGLEGALAPLKIKFHYASFSVSENQPFFNLKASIFSWDIFNSPFAPMVFIFLFSSIFGFRYKNKPIFFLLAGLASAVAGLNQIRLITLFAFIFLPAVSSNFNGVFLAIKNWLRQKRPKLAVVLGYSLVVIISAVYPYKAYDLNADAASRGYKNDWGIGLGRHSNDAGEFFKNNNLKGPIFNDYDIGGYIIYHLFPKERVFVDNNGADSYPVSFFDDVFIPALSSEEKWIEARDKYNLNAIFISLRDGSPVVGSFLLRRLRDPLWSLVYIDSYAVILLRNIPQNSEVINKFSTPGNLNERINHMLTSDDVLDRIIAGRFIYLMGSENLSTSVLKKVVAEYPKNSWVWLYMGSIKVWKNDPQSLISAIIFLENAIDMGEKTPESYMWLGLAYFRTGQFEKAEDSFQKSLYLDPDRYDTTNYLNQLQGYLNPKTNQ
ncbi:MAG: tetratricopeptide repeat protein [Candidatus Yanofskybacteria bacterium]|nr:tetratricopeptide repeat protein [Candidatus Yanofskybacteria bacterium]